ncbi:DNA-processing protein DprA [Isobaculum melis]|uniref:DNA processing protein n=1 Tax=Isobaculum melis TaxID=142588 RepID=A0A1H9RZM8_9LACT|nr:DNA-processing protein DprA [Isobaculum melis]SER77329.1 DNA processing protein [Isobaculum melis]
MNKEELKQQIFHLFHCKHMTTKGIIYCIAACIDQAEISPYELALIAQLPKGVIHDFLESYHQVDIPTLVARYQEQNIKWFTMIDTCYPSLFKEMDCPPVLLFYQGDISLLSKKKMAVVGCRKMSQYGKRSLQCILPGLIKEDYVIVSGLARGIDTCSHQLALSLKGKTIGVVGAGLDVVYPKENAFLQKKIATEQLLLSEYPIGSPPKKYHFPMRNRIIAALGQGCLVVEAKKRSGSLITANLALEYGKSVFAVPGSITSASSMGTNELIQQGAKSVYHAQHILEELG